MATILGPLAENVRLQYTISFTIPVGYAGGNATITDTLPAGLSLYLNNATTITDDLNSVSIATSPVTVLTREDTLATGYTIAAAGNTVTIVIAAANLTANANTAVTITLDTIVNNSMILTADQTISNTAKVVLTGYEGTSAAADLTLVKVDPLIQAPASIQSDATEVILELTIPAITNDTDIFNYYVDYNFGTNLSYTAGATPLNVTGYIGSTAGTPFAVTEVTGGTASRQEFTFTRTTAMSGQPLILQVKTVPNGLVAGTPVNDTATLSIGGAKGVAQTFTINVTQAPQALNVIKNVVTA